MRILLDTHAFIWALTNDKRLTKAARGIITNADDVFISAASIWEISIKSSIGKIDADPNALLAEIPAVGFRELPITATHAAAVSALPDLHRDPFDRLLVAQAITEPLRLLTADPVISQYTELTIRI